MNPDDLLQNEYATLNPSIGRPPLPAADQPPGDPGFPVLSNVIRKKYSDFSAAALTKDVTLFSLPKVNVILSIAAYVSQAFSGGAIATYTISVGQSGASTGLLTAQNVMTTGFKNAIGTDFTTNRPFYSTSGPTTIVATATSTGANLNAATAGTIDFYIVYYTFPQL